MHATLWGLGTEPVETWGCVHSPLPPPSIRSASATVPCSRSTWAPGVLWCCVATRLWRRLWWTRRRNSVGEASRPPSTGSPKAMVRWILCGGNVVKQTNGLYFPSVLLPTDPATQGCITALPLHPCLYHCLSLWPLWPFSVCLHLPASLCPISQLSQYTSLFSVSPRSSWVFALEAWSYISMVPLGYFPSHFVCFSMILSPSPTLFFLCLSKSHYLCFKILIPLFLCNNLLTPDLLCSSVYIFRHSPPQF